MACGSTRDRARHGPTTDSRTINLVSTADLSGALLANHHEVAYNLTLTVGILVGFSWLSWTSTYLYRIVSHRSVLAHDAEVAS